MPDDIPTYWRGDRIKLRLEVEHEVNLAGVHAIFRRKGDTYELWLRLAEGGLSLTEWRGDTGSARRSWRARSVSTRSPATTS